MLVVCYSYVFVCIRMFRMLLVCYSYVTRMYPCGVLVMIVFQGDPEAGQALLNKRGKTEKKKEKKRQL